MEIHRIVDPSFDVNVYLVQGLTASLLVDAGTGRQSALVAGEIEARLEGRALTHLLLTHRHFDHVGGARDFAKRYGVSPRISVDDAPPLIQGDVASTGAIHFGGSMGPTPVVVVEYGAQFDLGDGTLEVLSTPGHTVGSICILGDDGSLFTGDTVFPYGGVGRFDLETGNFDQLVESVKRLNALGATNLYPGHGEPVLGEAAEHLRWALGTLQGYGG